MARRRPHPEPPQWVELLDANQKRIGWYAEQGSEIVVRWPDGRERKARASEGGNRGLALLMLSQGPHPGAAGRRVG